jgi:hypothetical protein
LLGKALVIQNPIGEISAMSGHSTFYVVAMILRPLYEEGAQSVERAWLWTQYKCLNCFE